MIEGLPAKGNSGKSSEKRTVLENFFRRLPACTLPSSCVGVKGLSSGTQKMRPCSAGPLGIQGLRWFRRRRAAWKNNRFARIFASTVSGCAPVWYCSGWLLLRLLGMICLRPMMITMPRRAAWIGWLPITPAKSARAVSSVEPWREASTCSMRVSSNISKSFFIVSLYS